MNLYKTMIWNQNRNGHAPLKQRTVITRVSMQKLVQTSTTQQYNVSRQFEDVVSAQHKAA